MSVQALLLTIGNSAPVAGYTAWYRGDSYEATSAGQWDDKSSNANHMDTSANAPTAVASDANFNSKPTVDFDGTNDFVNNSAIVWSDLITNSAFTIFVVARAESFGAGDGAAVDQRGIFGDSGGNLGIGIGSSKLEGWNFDGSTDYTGNPAVDLDTVYGMDFRHDGGSLKLLVSGKSEATVSSGNTSALTGVPTVGRNYDGSRFWNGQIAEMIFYNTVLSTDERALVRTYLASRYAITW